MNSGEIVAIVLLAVFGNLFILAFIVSFCRQQRRAKKAEKNWSDRYPSRAHKRLENKKRVWAMFGLAYEGTIDDVRQSDDEDEDGEGKVITKCGTIHIEQRETWSPPPAYIPGLAELGPKDVFWGLRPEPPCPQPQPPGRIHDRRRDNDELSTVIVSPRPQRHIQLRSPELAVTSPLRRSETTRSSRRYSAPPVPARMPENPLPAPSQYASESQLTVAGAEPPLSPRRLDSISRRHM